MLDTPLLSVLQTALNYSSVRQDALADNLANVNTPGYKRKDASFDAVLAQANSEDSPFELEGAVTQDGQPAFGGDPANGQISVTTDNSGAMRLDGNNVDVDVEMGRLAKNQIYFQGLSQLISGQFSDIKNVIANDK